MSASLPEITSLLALPGEAQHAVLDTLFEPSQHLRRFATTLFAQQQQQSQTRLSSYQDLIDAVGAYLNGLSTSSLPEDRGILFEILGSHPRLGEKSSAKLSEMSKKEQANLKTENNGSAENDTEEQLRRLNGVYEERFPGLRYVYGVLCGVMVHGL